MSPRTAQKKRTRNALIAAAKELAARGEELTIAGVADAAEISRATAYRYYSDAGALAIEVTLELELLSADVLLEGEEDVRARVHKVARYYLQFVRDHEGAFRQFLAQTMSLWAQGDQTELRGARRVRAFTTALAPVRDQMSGTAFTELVARLSMLTGLEQLIATSDVLGLDPDTADDMQQGIVDAVLDRYLPR